MPKVLRFNNMDEAEAIFFGRELESVKQRTFDKRYPLLKARTLIPVDSTTSPGANTVQYEQFDQVGIGQIIANYAKDLPRADIKGKEFRSPLRSIGSSFGYSIQDIRAAKMAGMPLEQRKADAAKRAILQKENQVAFFGDTEHNLPGFFNNPNMLETVLPADGTGSSALWSAKTGDQILRDLMLFTKTIFTATLGVESPNTILFPPSLWVRVNELRMPQSDWTVLRWFLQNSTTIKNADQVAELETAGASGKPRIIAYDRNPDKLWLEIPQDFEQLAPQEKGLEYEIPCHSRCGGTIIPYPLSITYSDDAGPTPS